MPVPDPLSPAAPRPFPRSLVAVAALGAGLAIGRDLVDVPAALAFSLAATLCSIAATSRGHLCRAGLILAVVCFGTGWFALRFHEREPDNLGAMLDGAEPPRLVTVRGRLLDAPRAAPRERDPLIPPLLDEPSLRFHLAVSAIEHDGIRTPAAGTLRVRLAPGGRPLAAGDRVILTGAYEPIAPPANPGEIDRRLLARQDGVRGTLRAANPGLARIDPEEPGTLETITGQWLRLRAGLVARANELLLGGADPGPGRALLAALILGENEPALRDVRSAFTRLGLAHLLAISGFHLAVMVGVVLFALRLVGDLGWIEPAVAGALVILYLTILPFQAPVWRAALMVLGLLAADALGRRHDRLGTLGWIAALLLLWRPMDLWSMGFQLSFGLVGVLLWIGDRSHARLFTPPLKGTIDHLSPWRVFLADPARRLFSTNLLCGAAATPLVIWHTGLFSPAAAVAGFLMVLPVVALMIGGYATLALGVLVPPLAGPASAGLEALAGATAWVVGLFDAIPGTSMRMPSVSLAWATGATMVVLYWFGRAHRRDASAWVATLALAAWLAAEWRVGSALPRSVALRIDTLAVGDGTCHLVRSGRDTILWDCGSLTPGVGRATVPRAVRALGAADVPTAVITHANLDHYNGLLDAAEPLRLRTVLISPRFASLADARPSGPESYVLTELARRGVRVRAVAAGDTLRLGEGQLEFLSPPPDADWRSTNDHSLVARFVAPGPAPRTLLLTGDIEERAMAALREGHPRLRADIFEAPHHGSPRSAALAFAAALDPAIVLQSTGPRRAGDERWAHLRAGRRWHCTATGGAAWAEITRDGGLRSGEFRPGR